MTGVPGRLRRAGILACALLGACGAYDPRRLHTTRSEDVPAESFHRRVETVNELLRAAEIRRITYVGPDNSQFGSDAPRGWIATPSGFQETASGTVHPWGMLPEAPEVWWNAGNLYRVSLYGTIAPYAFHFHEESQARRFAAALAGLRRDVRVELASSDADFERALRSYRALNPKPALPEEGRRFAAQAEESANLKRYREAAGLYQRALAVSPWWAQGWYNSALLLAELGEFETAVAAMKRYVALAPDAPDAGAAQDQIYKWDRRRERRP